MKNENIKISKFLEDNHKKKKKKSPWSGIGQQKNHHETQDILPSTYLMITSYYVP